MARDIAARLRQALQEEDERMMRQRSARADAGDIERAFKSVMQAAEELRRELQSTAGITLIVSPDSVWLSLADRELKVTYDPESYRFLGDESAHAWIDGEPSSDRHGKQPMPASSR